MNVDDGGGGFAQIMDETYSMTTQAGGTCGGKNERVVDWGAKKSNIYSIENENRLLVSKDLI
jgi:hypothetical protein